MENMQELTALEKVGIDIFFKFHLKYLNTIQAFESTKPPEQIRIHWFNGSYDTHNL